MKARVVKAIVAVYVVLDDGEHLHEAVVPPMEIPASELDEFLDGGGKEAFKQLVEDLENAG